MLAITTPDAIAFGSMLAAILAAYAGLVKGDSAKKAAPPDLGLALIGSTIVDRQTLRELTDAVNELAAVIRAGIAVGESRDHLADTLRGLVDRIDRHGAIGSHQ